MDEDVRTLFALVAEVTAESAITSHATAFLAARWAASTGDFQSAIDQFGKRVTDEINKYTAGALADFTLHQNVAQLARLDKMMTLAREIYVENL